mgnify:CR=1 FL=1
MNRRMLNSQNITTRGAKKNQIEETFTDIIKHLSAYDDRQPTNHNTNKTNKFAHLESIISQHIYLDKDFHSK